MRVPRRPQSHLRYPLSRIFASQGAVRVLRELARHGGKLSIPALVGPTRLSAEGVRNVLADLSTIRVVEPVGQGRAVLYHLRTAHPLHGALVRLFEEEEARGQRVLQSLRQAAHAMVPGIVAVWIYGSVARGEDAPMSDLDVALVLPGQDVESATATYRQHLAPVLDREQVTLSAVGLSSADVRRLADSDHPWWRNLVAEAQPVMGPPPAILAERLQRTTADERAQVA